MTTDGTAFPSLMDTQQPKPTDQYLKAFSAADQNELGKAQALASMVAPSSIQTIRVVVDIAIIILGWLSVTLEVFIRRDFGERYLSWVRIFMAYMTFGVVGTLLTFYGWSQGQSLSLLGLVSIAFVVMTIVHRVRIHRRNAQGTLWHSMSFGVSWLSPLIDRIARTDETFAEYRPSDWTLYRFIEPIIFLMVGIAALIGPLAHVAGIIQFASPETDITGLMRVADRPLGLWLVLTSLALLVKNNVVYTQLRGRMLNLVDAQIEGTHLHAALEGQPKEKTSGFSFVPLDAPVRAIIEQAPAAVDIAAVMRETLSAAPRGSSKAA